MTLQEKIQKKAEGYGELASVFLEGANFALNNMYINYQEQKPPIGVEVIAYNHKWVDEDFNPNGTIVGFLSDDGFISAFWRDEQDCYRTINKLHCESNKDFFLRGILIIPNLSFGFQFQNYQKNRRLNYDNIRNNK